MSKNKKETVMVQPADTKKRHIIFLLDETGSMYDCMSDTIGGFNSFIDKQISENSDMPFSLTLFNADKIEKRYVNVKITDVEKLSTENYTPNNRTPLWDAIGKTIQELNVEEALFIILTDGLENASKEFNANSIKSLISDKEKIGWQFLFLGAGLDDFSDAKSVNIYNTSSYQKGNSMRAFAAVSETVVGYYRSGKLNYKQKMDDSE